MERGSGILMPIFSIPSKSGFGSLGKEAFKFIDYLKECKQKYLQVLPINDVDKYGSPFSSTCMFSGNPLFIDLREFFSQQEIVEYGLNKKNEYKDYRKRKLELLYVWFSRSNYKKEIQEFEINNPWVDGYSKFMTLKSKYHQLSNFTKEYKDIDNPKTIEFFNRHLDIVNFYKFTQYIFFKQWKEFKEYANKNGILIIGDSPCNASMDSYEAYCNKDKYLLDENLNPTLVAGVPPDYFSDEGQCWNTLIYNYEELKKDNYKYLIDKYKYLLNIYDYLKIDHFRGLEAYYTIPFGNKDGKVGEWKLGPGYDFINLLRQQGINNLILEDLGIISDGVIRLKEYSKYPGLKVFGFAFGEVNSKFLPINYEENSVAYIGTHDNDTYLSMLKNEEFKNKVKDYLKVDSDDNKLILESTINDLYKSKSDVVILSPQDLLLQDNKYRFNTPGTVNNNWMYNTPSRIYNKEVKEMLIKLVRQNRR